MLLESTMHYEKFGGVLLIAISANEIVNDGYTFPDPYGCSVVRVDQILQELVACTEDMEIEENENDDEDGNTTFKKYKISITNCT